MANQANPKIVNPSILAVDDDESFLTYLAQALADEYDVTTVANASGAMSALKDRDFDCVLLDVKLPEIDGFQLLKVMRGLKPYLPVVMLTGDKTPAKIVKAVKDGASDYVVKEPGDLAAEIKFRIGKAIEQRSLATKAHLMERKLTEESRLRYEIIGHSTPTLKLKGLISQMKGHHTPVLILGESGTGKELVARALNTQEIGGVARPLVCVNCAAIPENLAESELFGHVKGAFTGAHQNQDGKFFAAHGGDIFLDEIGDLPLAVQAKLLRILQEKEVVRVGSNTPVKINIRVIAATHKNLNEAVAQGKFREDLYYRLAVMTLYAPALRERTEDIPDLVEHFLKEMGSALKVSSEAMDLLKIHKWPGNIRALKNCIERALILAQVEGVSKINPAHIVLDNTLAQSADKDRRLVPKDLLPEIAEEVCAEGLKNYNSWAEKTFFEAAYEVTGKNKTRLAEKLSVSRDFIHRKLKFLGVGAEGEA